MVVIFSIAGCSGRYCRGKPAVAAGADAGASSSYPSSGPPLFGAIQRPMQPPHPLLQESAPPPFSSAVKLLQLVVAACRLPAYL